MEFDEWMSNVREIELTTGSPLKVTRSVWTIIEKKKWWAAVSHNILESYLNSFCNMAMKVLPSFEDEHENDDFFIFKDSKNNYSKVLKSNITETMALLTNVQDKMRSEVSFAARHKVENVVRKILEGPDWKVWTELNAQLPNIAESSPELFITLLEEKLEKIEGRGGGLFGGESIDFSRKNPATGILWALETLSWNESRLVRCVLLLSALVEFSRFENWPNKPVNSLINVFLPWHSYTNASWLKKKVALRCIKEQFPDVFITLAIALLPNKTQTSFGNSYPQWEDAFVVQAEKGIINEEYWLQINDIAKTLTDFVKEKHEYLTTLIDSIENLPKDSFEEMLSYILISKEDFDEGLNESIYEKLNKLLKKHRRFHESDWAMGEDELSKVEEVVIALQPKSSNNLYASLFSHRDYDLYDDISEDWGVREEKLNEKRIFAVSQIFKDFGFPGLIQFSKEIESQAKLGSVIAQIDNNTINAWVISECFDNVNTDVNEDLLKSFIYSSFHKKGWGWVETTFNSTWKESVKLIFILSLPFQKDVWLFAKRILNREVDYWKLVRVNVHQGKEDISYAIKQLLKVERFEDVFNCFAISKHINNTIDAELASNALMSFVTKNKKEIDASVSHAISEMIESIQRDDSVPVEKKCGVEWAYLKLIIDFSNMEPKYLYKLMANSPENFCEIISKVYRSESESGIEKFVSEKDKEIASNCWSLLHGWNIPPGLSEQGGMDEGIFKEWVDQVKVISSKAGRYDVAMYELGKVLVYTPKDEGGLWINLAVAKEINSPDSKEIRNGFKIEVYNSRGAHIVDVSGAQEIKLSNIWEVRASELETEALTRFASIAREISIEYLRESEQVKFRYPL
ncbi:UNVERIFIED_ORG: hypothetical protein C7430_1011142 [Pantoea agglomerans]|uniref:DUF4132 domain-containing protein n=1 Tax=Enterobacter agglomerans TaxID=549 RepID=A0ABD6XYF4_ENTAG|nr:hypothetical protein [Pantoea agglomerans]WNK72364.1 hypothetical protein RM155_04865 [Pantoea agglomerans]